MGNNDGFFQLILIGLGVFVVFSLIANMTSFGVSGPWAQVNTLITPLIIVICFLGFSAYVVINR